jgi:hypothetical protein
MYYYNKYLKYSRKSRINQNGGVLSLSCVDPSKIENPDCCTSENIRQKSRSDVIKDCLPLVQLADQNPDMRYPDTGYLYQDFDQNKYYLSNEKFQTHEYIMKPHDLKFSITNDDSYFPFSININTYRDLVFAIDEDSLNDISFGDDIKINDILTRATKFIINKRELSTKQKKVLTDYYINVEKKISANPQVDLTIPSDIVVHGITIYPNILNILIFMNRFAEFFNKIHQNISKGKEVILQIIKNYIYSLPLKYIKNIYDTMLYRQLLKKHNLYKEHFGSSSPNPKLNEIESVVLGDKSEDLRDLDLFMTETLKKIEIILEIDPTLLLPFLASYYLSYLKSPRSFPVNPELQISLLKKFGYYKKKEQEGGFIILPDLSVTVAGVQFENCTENTLLNFIRFLCHDKPISECLNKFDEAYREIIGSILNKNLNQQNIIEITRWTEFIDRLAYEIFNDTSIFKYESKMVELKPNLQFFWSIFCKLMYGDKVNALEATNFSVLETNINYPYIPAPYIIMDLHRLFNINIERDGSYLNKNNSKIRYKIDILENTHSKFSKSQ